MAQTLSTNLSNAQDLSYKKPYVEVLLSDEVLRFEKFCNSVDIYPTGYYATGTQRSVIAGDGSISTVFCGATAGKNDKLYQRRVSDFTDTAQWEASPTLIWTAPAGFYTWDADITNHISIANRLDCCVIVGDNIGGGLITEARVYVSISLDNGATWGAFTQRATHTLLTNCYSLAIAGQSLCSSIGASVGSIYYILGNEENRYRIGSWTGAGSAFWNLGYQGNCIGTFRTLRFSANDFVCSWISLFEGNENEYRIYVSRSIGGLIWQPECIYKSKFYNTYEGALNNLQLSYQNGKFFLSFTKYHLDTKKDVRQYRYYLESTDFKNWSDAKYICRYQPATSTDYETEYEQNEEETDTYGFDNFQIFYNDGYYYALGEYKIMRAKAYSTDNPEQYMDITEDVLGLGISEQHGSAASLDLKLRNDKGQYQGLWWGDDFQDYATTDNLQLKYQRKDIISDAEYNKTEPNLLGYWKFDGNLNDSSGNGKTLTAYNTPTYAQGVVDGTAVLASASSQYFGRADSSFNKTSGSITLECWAKPISAVSGYPMILSLGKMNNNINYCLYFYTGQVNFQFRTSDGTSNVFTGVMTVNINRWHHIVAMHTWGDASSTKIYVNGVKLTGTWTQGNGNRFPLGTDNNLYIGRRSDGYYFDGQISEVRIYDRLLNTTEITNHYNYGLRYHIDNLGIDYDEPATSELAYYKFDNGATDSSGNSKTLTPNNAPTYGVGKLSYATILNGAASQSFSRTDADFLISSGAISMEVWVYPTNAPNYPCICEMGDDGNRNYVFDIDHTTMKPRFWYDHAGGTAVSQCNKVLSLNTWYHIVWTHTWGDATKLKCYIDGVLFPSGFTAGTGNETPLTGSNNFRVGTRSVARFYTGRIDELRILKRELSASEVKMRYAHGHGSRYSDQLTTPDQRGFLESPKNIIRNSSFEEGLSHWNRYDGETSSGGRLWVIDESVFKDGLRSCRQENLNANGWCSVYQYVPCKPNTRYRLMAWWKGTNARSVHFVISGYSVDWTNGAQILNTGGRDGTWDWEEAVYEFTTRSTDVWLLIAFNGTYGPEYGGWGTGTGYSWVDNYRVIEVGKSDAYNEEKGTLLYKGADFDNFRYQAKLKNMFSSWQLQSCDNSADFTISGGVLGNDAADKKEGTNSLTFNKTSVAQNYTTINYTPASVINITGKKYLSFWLKTPAQAELDLVLYGWVYLYSVNSSHYCWYMLDKARQYPTGETWYKIIIDIDSFSSRTGASSGDWTQLYRFSLQFIVANNADTFGNFKLDDVRFQNTRNSEIGLIARAIDENNCLKFVTKDLSRVELHKEVNGVVTTLGTALYDTSTQQDYYFGMKLSGNNKYCYISTSEIDFDNDTPLITETSDSTYTTGKVGIYNQCSHTLFDDLKVNNRYIGAQALKRNSKLTVKLGLYYSGSNHAEITKGSYYIDDIEQTTSINENTLDIKARDKYKLLKDFVADQQYDLLSPLKWFDDFAVDSIGNYTQNSGTWTIAGGDVNNAPAVGADDMLTLNCRKVRTFCFQAKCRTTQLANTGFGLIFGFIDTNNTYLLQLQNGGTNCGFWKKVGGVWTNIANYAYAWIANTWYWMRVLADQNNQFTFDISTDGINWTNLATNVYDETWTEPGLIGLRSSCAAGAPTNDFDDVTAYTLEFPKTGEEIIKYFGSKADISSYTFGTLWKDTFDELSTDIWDTGSAIGTWTVSGNVLTGTPLAPGSRGALLTTSAYSFTNYKATMTINSWADDINGYGGFIYRATDINNYYILTYYTGGMGFDLYIEIVKVTAGVGVIMKRAVIEKNSNLLEIWVYGKWVFAKMGFATVYYYDTNHPTESEIGFGCGSYQDFSLSEYSELLDFYLPVGEDAESAINKVTETIQAISFIRYDESFKSKRIRYDDNSSKNIDKEVLENTYLQSDKELLNNVMVTGGEYTTATGIKTNYYGEWTKGTLLNDYRKIRYTNIEDTNLFSKKQCQDRAYFEIKDKLKFSNQPDFKSSIIFNPELYDVITLNDIKTNLIDVPLRIYNLDWSYSPESGLELDIGIGSDYENFDPIIYQEGTFHICL